VGGSGPTRKWEGGRNFFLVETFHFLALKAQLGLLVVLVSAFLMVSTVWSISCLLFFYSRCLRCSAICKSGGTCPLALWSRRHWVNHRPTAFVEKTGMTASMEVNVSKNRWEGNAKKSEWEIISVIQWRIQTKGQWGRPPHICLSTFFQQVAFFRMTSAVHYVYCRQMTTGLILCLQSINQSIKLTIL